MGTGGDGLTNGTAISCPCYDSCPILKPEHDHLSIIYPPVDRHIHIGGYIRLALPSLRFISPSSIYPIRSAHTHAMSSTPTIVETMSEPKSAGTKPPSIGSKHQDTDLHHDNDTYIAKHDHPLAQLSNARKHILLFIFAIVCCFLLPPPVATKPR